MAVFSPTILPTSPAERSAVLNPCSEGGEVSRACEERFVLELARVLHRWGASADRLESAVTSLAEALGLQAQIFCTPTAVQLAFGDEASGEVQRVHLMRAVAGEVDLSKLALLAELREAVVERRVTAAEALTRVAAIDRAPAPYSARLIPAAFAVASGTAAVFLGGSAVDVAASSGIGCAIGWASLWSGRRAAAAQVLMPTAGLLSVLAAALLVSLGVPIGSERVVLSALIALLPGFTLTVALKEIATGHLVSGNARLASAGLTFLVLGFGVALGRAVTLQLGSAPPPAPGSGLPAWSELAALALAPFAFGVLFQARRRDLGWIVLSSVSAFVGARLGAAWLGPELGAFVGALSVGLSSNGIARLAGLPTSVPLVPGIMLLVPGSLGYRSIAFLMAQDVLTGVETAFRMALVATALVAGLLASNLLLAPRREL